MPKTILVVDDDATFCKLIALTLKENDFQTETAFTGEAALEAYQRQPPDLILLDIAMPGLSGFDVASRIRELEKTNNHHSLIVIMTAHARSFAVSVGFNAGIDSYITKPVLPLDVLAQVRTLLPANAG